jgi:hypothetical protein
MTVMVMVMVMTAASSLSSLSSRSSRSLSSSMPWRCRRGRRAPGRESDPRGCPLGGESSQARVRLRPGSSRRRRCRRRRWRGPQEAGPKGCAASRADPRGGPRAPPCGAAVLAVPQPAQAAMGGGRIQKRRRRALAAKARGVTHQLDKDVLQHLFGVVDVAQDGGGPPQNDVTVGAVEGGDVVMHQGSMPSFAPPSAPSPPSPPSSALPSSPGPHGELRGDVPWNPKLHPLGTSDC